MIASDGELTFFMARPSPIRGKPRTADLTIVMYGICFKEEKGKGKRSREERGVVGDFYFLPSRDGTIPKSHPICRWRD
jgi:hypothetical protein